MVKFFVVIFLALLPLLPLFAAHAQIKVPVRVGWLLGYQHGEMSFAADQVTAALPTFAMGAVRFFFLSTRFGAKNAF